MRVLVTGGRDFPNESFVHAKMGELHREVGFTTIIHGAATGVDTFADTFAYENDIRVERYPVLKSDWLQYGKSAGIRRNGTMLMQSKPDFCMAFPGGTGTANMIERVEQACLPMWQSKTILFNSKMPETWFLSNFYEDAPFEDQFGVEWKSSEHYYQAKKADESPELQEWIRSAKDPAESKTRANSLVRRPDWPYVKEDVMREALRLKFAPDSIVANMLIETDPHYLVEFAPWRDQYWGVDRNMVGKNRLGILLMERRDELRR